MKFVKLIAAALAAAALVSCSVRTAGGDESKAPSSSDTGDSKAFVTEPETTEKKEDVVTKASFIGCGDNIIYFGTYRDAASQAYAGGRKYNFKPIYDNVADRIAGADISFINQETVTSQSFEPESYPTFNSPVDLTYDIQEIGFDVVNIANNHMLDKGAKGLRDSYDNWIARGVTLIGCYEEKTSGRYITYYEKNGINIAFVSYTYGTNLSEDPAHEGLYAPYLRQSDVAGDVKEARENSDFVIVSVHWGDEGSLVPNDEQKKYAKIMADNGADVIIGHHPHALQPIEWIQGEGGGRTLCVYSLGNFVHEQDREYNAVGGMIAFDIVKKNDSHAEVSSPEFIPTVCHYPSNFYNNKVYYLSDYTQELAAQHAVNTYYRNTMSLAGLQKIVNDTIPAEFLSSAAGQNNN